MSPDDLEPMDRLLAERACERLIIDFVRRLDLGEPGTVAELFTPDGAWEWPPANAAWPAGRRCARYFGTRPADRLSRRLMTNILVTVAGPATANATSYLTTYRVDGYAGGMLPPMLPVNVGHYEDTFRRSAATGCWPGGSRSSRSGARPGGCRRRLVTPAGKGRRTHIRRDHRLAGQNGTSSSRPPERVAFRRGLSHGSCA